MTKRVSWAREITGEVEAMGVDDIELEKKRPTDGTWVVSTLKRWGEKAEPLKTGTEC